MDIEEYRKQFIDEIRFEAEHEGTAPETMFVEKTLALMEEMGEVIDPIPMSIKMRGRGNRLMAFDAYAYDEEDGTLILIASDFSNQHDNAFQLTNSRIAELFSRMFRFIEETVNGRLFDYCDEHDDAYYIGKEFKKKIELNVQLSEIKRFKFIIITNATLSWQVKNLLQPDFLDRPVELNVWTLECFYNNYVSSNNEVIEIETKDFGFEHIRSIEAERNECFDYNVYLGFLPGQFLANIVHKYGSRLFQRNTGSPVKFVHKVMRGIYDTAVHNPNKFLALNNGIVAVTQSIRISNNCEISSFKDFQIVDGSQTAYALAKAVYYKEKDNIDHVFVPMKLIVIKAIDEFSRNKADSLTNDISICTQKVIIKNPSNINSNHPFNILMQGLSRKVKAPAVNGSPYQTTWFYERCQDEWDREQVFMTSLQKQSYCLMTPKKQVISKEKLARCVNAFLQQPQHSCKGSMLSYNHFLQQIDILYKDLHNQIDVAFFKKCVCQVILYDSLDSLVRSSSWYSPQGSAKAWIVPYTIAKLMSLIPADKEVNWAYIWKHQNIYPELSDELTKLAYVTNTCIREIAGKNSIRETSKLESTYLTFKDTPYELSTKFKETLITKQQ